MDKAEKIKKEIKNPVVLNNVLRGYKTKITGSKVFGGYDSKTSDIDVLVYDPVHNGLFSLLMRRAQGYYIYGEYNASNYFDSIYVKQWNLNKSDYVLFNLLCFYDKQEFGVWSKATDIYRELLRSKRFNELSKDKLFRVTIFNTLKTGIREIVYK